MINQQSTNNSFVYTENEQHVKIQKLYFCQNRYTLSFNYKAFIFQVEN